MGCTEVFDGSDCSWHPGATVMCKIGDITICTFLNENLIIVKVQIFLQLIAKCFFNFYMLCWKPLRWERPKEENTDI